MARPTKLTPEVQHVFVQAMRAGSTQKSACRFAGIGHTTFANWRARAEQGEPAYRAFMEELEKAEGEFIVTSLAQIGQAAKAGQWTAAAWTLERRYPEEYGRQVIEQKVSGQVVHAHAWIERLQQSWEETRLSLPPGQSNGHAESASDIIDADAAEQA